MPNLISEIPVLIIKVGERNYPKQLLDLVDPPEQLHVRGHFDPKMFASSLAIVGSRQVTPYGASIVNTFVPPLVKQKVITISGFMYGVDTLVHKVTLAQRGVTVAVLGNGLNHLYPKENESLYTEIIQHRGCLISEYPEDFPPQTWTFPKRNRIVAALASLGTFVVEAAELSGTLITAQYADALNRPLYCAPGPLFSKTSVGTNRMIKDKLAQMVISPQEIKTKTSE